MKPPPGRERLVRSRFFGGAEIQVRPPPTATAHCGCRFHQRDGVAFCPLHAAAPDLLRIARELYEKGSHHPDCEWRFGDCTCGFEALLKEAEAVMKAAMP